MQVDNYPKVNIQAMEPTEEGMQIAFADRGPILVKPQESITLDYGADRPYVIYIEVKPKRRFTDAQSTN